MTSVDIVENAKRYAIECHTGTNHLYDGKPYHEAHLQSVVDIAEGFRPAQWNDNTWALVVGACWTHDVIEDCRQTYHNVKERCGATIADITYALTNLKGRTRAERASSEYYHFIRQEGVMACFVKLCDRIANVEYSIKTNSSMLKAYRSECVDYRDKLMIGNPDSPTNPLAPLFYHLDYLLYKEKVSVTDILREA